MLLAQLEKQVPPVQLEIPAQRVPQAQPDCKEKSAQRALQVYKAKLEPRALRAILAQPVLPVQVAEPQAQLALQGQPVLQELVVVLRAQRDQPVLLVRQVQGLLVLREPLVLPV